MVDNKAFYDFRAPQFFDFSPSSSEKSVHCDEEVFKNSGLNMEVDFLLPLRLESNVRRSSTPNKRDSCTQTPSERTEEEEQMLSDALNTVLHLEKPNQRRSVRFNESIDVCPKTPDSSVAGNPSGNPNLNSKRSNTPIVGQTWHQALKYRSVEQRVAIPKPGGRVRRNGLIAEPTLKVARTPSTVPRTVQVKVRVDPKSTVRVEPFKLTSYKPKQSPLEDPVRFFQRNRDTPARPTQVKAAVRRIPVADKVDSPNTTTFRARPPASLYQKPFVPKYTERPPIKIEPFRLHTEERAKKREEYDQKIQLHLIELEAERQRLAAEREREEAIHLKELRKVKFHARPVPAFVYSVTPKNEKSPKTPSFEQKPRTNTRTI